MSAIDDRTPMEAKKNIETPVRRRSRTKPLKSGHKIRFLRLESTPKRVFFA